MSRIRAFSRHAILECQEIKNFELSHFCAFYGILTLLFFIKFNFSYIFRQK